MAIDAMGEIAERIVQKGGNYLLALKGNPPGLLEDVELYLADPAGSADAARADEVDADQGRAEERACRVVDAQRLAEPHPDWKKLLHKALLIC